MPKSLFIVFRWALTFPYMTLPAAVVRLSGRVIEDSSSVHPRRCVLRISIRSVKEILWCEGG